MDWPEFTVRSLKLDGGQLRNGKGFTRWRVSRFVMNWLDYGAPGMSVSQAPGWMGLKTERIQRGEG